MKKLTFHAVILAGGSGERFWPLSTPERPKQFLNVFGGQSLIGQAVDRLSGLVPPSNIHVITAENLVKTTLHELPVVPKANVIGEPCRKDTAAAVATACGIVEGRDGENAVVAILTADQLMGNVTAFRKVLVDAVKTARMTDSIVTMGVTPTYPATGFGYIRLGDFVETKTVTSFRNASAFVEKPDEKTAKRYLASGRYAWNAGMFVWKVSTMKKSLLEGAPELAILERAVADAKSRDDIDDVLAAIYPQLTKISIDYAVMEKAKNILVSSADFGWDDVGTWTAVDKHLSSDGRRNVIRGKVSLLDVTDSVVMSHGGPEVAVLGVDNLVVIATRDNVLVASKDRVQDLKKLLKVIPSNDTAL